MSESWEDALKKAVAYGGTAYNLGNTVSRGAIADLLKGLGLTGVSQALPIISSVLGLVLNRGDDRGLASSGASLAASVADLLASSGASGTGPFGALYGIFMAIHAIQSGFDADKQYQKTWNDMARYKEGQGILGQIVTDLSGAKDAESLLAALNKPLGTQGTVGGVLASVLEGNLSGHYSTAEWEPDQNLQKLKAAFDKYGITATPYAGTNRINSIDELMHYSGGGTMGDREIYPNAGRAARRWGTLLNLLAESATQYDPTVDDNLPEWEWTPEKLANTMWNIDPTTPEGQQKYIDELGAWQERAERGENKWFDATQDRPLLGLGAGWERMGQVWKDLVAAGVTDTDKALQDYKSKMAPMTSNWG